MGVRFRPADCPGCGEPLRPRYSTFRHGTRGPLFPLGLSAGFVAVLAALVASFWAAFTLAADLFPAAPLTRRERGALTFVLQVPMFWLIAWGARAGWAALHRLPRTFTTGCETCSWTGPCRVYETADR